jgi:hypothetical protein
LLVHLCAGRPHVAFMEEGWSCRAKSLRLCRTTRLSLMGLGQPEKHIVWPVNRLLGVDLIREGLHRRARPRVPLSIDFPVVTANALELPLPCPDGRERLGLVLRVDSVRVESLTRLCGGER